VNLERLFIALTKAIEGSAPIALGASLAWGILSVLLSPCHLSSIPLIIGFISEQGRLTTRRAFGLSLLLQANEQIRAVNGQLALADLHPFAKQVFDTTQLGAVFKTYDSVELAVKALA